MISIRQPLSFSEIGKKDNQEDYLYPQSATTASRTFILCDGMGGHDNGEVASRVVAEALGSFLSSCSEVDIPTFEAGLEKAYEALDAIGGTSARKPGTTMACVCLNEDSYLVAHIGDSRVYHIRPSLYHPKLRSGGILYQSSDHSLVNDLLKAGELTEEEARDFPQKNIITRAMQPLDTRYKADVYMFDDIREGDYFFLCCDGILERLTNTRLCEILADKSLTDAGKLQAIKDECDGNTRDNYSCWLIPVGKVDLPPRQKNSDVIMAEMNGKGHDPEADGDPGVGALETMQDAPTVVARRSARRITGWLMIDILFIILFSLYVLWFAYIRLPEQTAPRKVEKVEQNDLHDGASQIKRKSTKKATQVSPAQQFASPQEVSSGDQTASPQEVLSGDQTASSSAKVHTTKAADTNKDDATKDKH